MDNHSCTVFLFTAASIPALGLIYLPIQWVLGTLSMEVKWMRHEADRSPPYNVKTKIHGAIPPFPHTPSWHGGELNIGTILPFTK
jgi:hypothetical protein